MQYATLKASPRTEHGKGPARRLRTTGQVPGVTYGRGSKTSEIAFPHDQLLSILTSERGRNTVIHVEGDGETYSVMVKDVVLHPVTRRLWHADFLRIDESRAIMVQIPFRITGKSKGELEGGTVVVMDRTLPVKCVPSQIPGHIDYDVSHLEMNGVARVRDLVLPEGIRVELPPERKLLVVQAPRIEAEPEPAAAAAVEGAEGAVPAEGEAAAAEGEAKGEEEK
jgi:large subunit ribosomal protein L25